MRRNVISCDCLLRQPLSTHVTKNSPLLLTATLCMSPEKKSTIFGSKPASSLVFLSF